MNKHFFSLVILFYFFSSCCVAQGARSTAIDQALTLLKGYRDKEALEIFEKTLAIQPENLDARWGAAEVLRRQKKYQQAEAIFNDIVRINPQYAPALNSLAYLRYRDNSLPEAVTLAQRVLKIDNLNKEDQAMAYMVLGMVNSRRASLGGILSKIRYGTQVKRYFQKAIELAPDMAEVYLGLGTFYLLAPRIAGGDVDKAIKELEYAAQLAPSFGMVAARLAQAYQKKGDLKNYRMCLARAQKLDPNNDVLKKILKDGE